MLITLPWRIRSVFRHNDDCDIEYYICENVYRDFLGKRLLAFVKSVMMVEGESPIWTSVADTIDHSIRNRIKIPSKKGISKRVCVSVLRSLCR